MVIQGECNMSLEQLVRAQAVLHERVAVWTICATIWIYAAGRRRHDTVLPQEDCWLWCYTTCLRTIGQGSQKSECEVAHRILGAAHDGRNVGWQVFEMARTSGVGR